MLGTVDGGGLFALLDRRGRVGPRKERRFCWSRAKGNIGEEDGGFGAGESGGAYVCEEGEE